MFPSSASSRKQMRQRLKSRIKPRGRPHLKQRRTTREANFGVRFALMIIDFFAMWLKSLKGVAGGVHLTFRSWLSLPCLPFVAFSEEGRDLVLTIFQAKARNQAKKQGPLRGLRNIREMASEVNKERTPPRQGPKRRATLLSSHGSQRITIRRIVWVPGCISQGVPTRRRTNSCIATERLFIHCIQDSRQDSCAVLHFEYILYVEICELCSPSLFDSIYTRIYTSVYANDRHFQDR